MCHRSKGLGVISAESRWNLALFEADGISIADHFSECRLKRCQLLPNEEGRFRRVSYDRCDLAHTQVEKSRGTSGSTRVGRGRSRRASREGELKKVEDGVRDSREHTKMHDANDVAQHHNYALRMEMTRRIREAEVADQRDLVLGQRDHVKVKALDAKVVELG